MEKTDQKVDVICQHGKNGDVIPLKVRLIDEDGLTQEFIIKSCKEIPAYISRFKDSSEEKIIRNEMHRRFECEAVIFKRIQRFHLALDIRALIWSLEI